MDESTRKKVLEIIRQAINEVVFDEVKQMPKRLQAKKEEMKKTKAQREQEAHDALFGRDVDEWSYKLQLHESIEERPKVTAEELEQFNKDFKSRFPGIYFEKQMQPGQNGQIVDFPVKNGQKDAVTSGRITVGQDVIGFSMSLLNGFKIRSIVENGKPKDFEIEKETKDVFSKILNLYEEVFKKRFNEIINPAEGEGDAMAPPAAEPPVAAAAPAPAPAAAPGAAATPPTPGV